MMPNEDDFDPNDEKWQQHRAGLIRLAEIQEELKKLVLARDRLLKELSTLKATLEKHRHAGSAIRLRATQILKRLTSQADSEAETGQPLAEGDEKLINELDASRVQLEHDVDMTERRLKIAQFEADSLADLLDDLEDQVAEIAAELDRGENGFLNDRN